MRSTIVGSAVALLGLFHTVTAASTTPVAYTDPNTGIDFQLLNANGNYTVAIALPETIDTDLIAQLVVPISKTGAWGAVSLGGGMLNHLLLVAWANGEEVVSTFRIAGAYANPPVYDATAVSALPIANGTFVNSTHFSYTFLCKGCIVGGTTTFTKTDENPVLGWALSSSNPTTPSDPGSALPYHDAGFGLYGQKASAAQSASFETWASWASAATGNGTAPVTPPTGNGTSVVPTISNSTYDVIVAGGGPAGIIAAERIAEAGLSVLLVERGPANTVALGSSEGLEWNNTLTQYDVPALGSSLSAIPGTKICSDTASMAGCLLGGSSSINGENFIRPPERDFKNWPAGWSWNDVSEAADRLYSRNPGTTQPSADGKHYDDMAYTTVSSYLGEQGWTELDSIKTPNEKRMVYSRPAWSITNNLRAGPARTYMPFAQDLENFTLKLETKVIQVKRTGSSVTGVLVELADGSQQIINLKQGGKVVLASGALSTPRILWNSGIGKSDALKIVQGGTTGVQLPDEADWIDLPVGHGLKDHAQAPLQFKTAANYTAYKYDDIASNPVESDVDLYYKGSGILTQAAQRMHLWTSVNGTDGKERFLQGTVSSMKDDTVTIKSFLTHGSSSTGELGITASGNTVLSVKPWLADPADKEALSGFIQWWIDITSQGNSTVDATMTLVGTPESILANDLISGDHWVGTTKMGIDDGRSNGTSVVDTDTKVYGTDNLFVVDASIHPDLPTGNTQAIIMVVAEHAAEKIAAFKVANGTASATPFVPSPSTTPEAATPSGSDVSSNAADKEYTLKEFIAFLEDVTAGTH
ncbi:Cellobiose dehydrogenase (acceptor) [Ascochyta rabiei]|uniref:Flavin adenine dinucleotide binding n=1 Tax=Didymella rabiei TaxID=5454 RepID=A0A162ZPG7_DIDRA|nr:Cellobiose dehydrogenase (acceptor) [Ascochyta rabiei]KZM20736.1 flavin adenine dinucleotide binding [Ascochyta rabiei]UPX17593.1 Cellobiose dehydrogenase (acceptor) [Ascochyta rabiei]